MSASVFDGFYCLHVWTTITVNGATFTIANVRPCRQHKLLFASHTSMSKRHIAHTMHVEHMHIVRIAFSKCSKYIHTIDICCKVESHVVSEWCAVRFCHFGISALYKRNCNSKAEASNGTILIQIGKRCALFGASHKQKGSPICILIA